MVFFYLVVPSVEIRIEQIGTFASSSNLGKPGCQFQLVNRAFFFWDWSYRHGNGVGEGWL